MRSKRGRNYTYDCKGDVQARKLAEEYESLGHKVKVDKKKITVFANLPKKKKTKE